MAFRGEIERSSLFRQHLNHGYLIGTWVLLCFLASVAAAQNGVGLDRTRARTSRASGGTTLAAASTKSPEAKVGGFLRSRGVSDDALESLRVVDSNIGPDGVAHFRMEQRVEGVVVYGAYAKASVNPKGELIHLIDRLFRITQTSPSRIDAPQALTAALANLYPARTDEFCLAEVRGDTLLFKGGDFYYREPTVTAVALPMSDGTLARGWLVETWTAASNELVHTVVGGDGRVLDVESRTAEDSYNVFIEDPLKGPQTVVNGPGAGNAESPVGWLGTGNQSTWNIIGNNVHTYLDSDANNSPDAGGTAVTDGNFLTAVNLAQSPTTIGNKSVAVQNLFYLNNVAHDILYSKGFDEAAGNFQSNNFGRGGTGNDAVNAEAQDGSGTDNANFSTPTDGSAPRMQMYLWTGNAPNAYVVNGGFTYDAYGSAFGPALTATGKTGPLAVYNDGTGVTSDGCEASTGPMTGMMAIVDRGTCNFNVKVYNAQLAGAIGVIIVNNVGTNDAFAPGGTDRKVKIPSAMVGKNDGTALKANPGTSATLKKSGVVALQIDGDIDADIVFHEYGHGLTWRMIGGMSGLLAGAIGEGASDVNAFLIDGDDRIGEYAYSRPGGIRRQPYDTYVGTYKDAVTGEVHNDGEIYAAAMWDVRRNYLGAGLSIGTLQGDWVNGMNYTPSTPAFEDMRDGMLQAVSGTGRECLIWRAFAARGIGVGADGTVNRRGKVTITESFAVPAACQ